MAIHPEPTNKTQGAQIQYSRNPSTLNKEIGVSNGTIPMEKTRIIIPEIKLQMCALRC
jgi:hypothetical protein